MRRWTDNEIVELRRLYTSMTTAEIAKHLGRSRMGVRMKAHKSGLKKDPPNLIKLTDEQTTWLKRNYCEMRNEVCATYLGISTTSVSRLGRKYGLAKKPEFMKECQAYSIKKAVVSRKLSKNQTGLKYNIVTS